jgi:hypothetical protein
VTARYDIAQLNVGRAVAPLDEAVMADFMNWLDEINALAERSPGFVWRLQGDSGNNTDLKISDDPRFIVNLSVWSSIDALYDFTNRSDHKTVFNSAGVGDDHVVTSVTELKLLCIFDPPLEGREEAD